MVDRYVVLARVAKIRQYVALLKKIRGLANQATFVKDPLIYGNAERYLQLAIQALLDISNHIVADMNLNLPADSKELFDLLAKHKVLPVRLSKRLAPMAGLGIRPEIVCLTDCPSRLWELSGFCKEGRAATRACAGSGALRAGVYRES